MRIKVIIHEQNAVLGKANRLLKFFSNKVAISFKKTKFSTKDDVFTGMPTRYKKNYSKQKINKFVILVLGGSQGAFFFDKMVKDVIIKIYRLSKISIYQQIFNFKNHKELENEYSKLNIEYEFFNYDKVLHKKLNTFDIAITRSGASALAELTFFNIPFIAIPFPYAKDNHQFYNAEFYNNKNSCWLVSQNNHCTDKIINIFKEVIENKKDYDIKKENLNKISYQNTWNNINKKLIDLINEN